ncbi:conserved oligomeric golgi complex subunit 4 [Holotrichia oblita]|uniref:Conserved oligomeric golgi complex subunit 4 n=1 Tax=Holotrichia oblita TaxID=644536 RepID=A0ACB9STP5_HOLOL|nr:conserved oligomeric golgi complex subunit 4 [Holotrichia oblita]
MALFNLSKRIKIKPLLQISALCYSNKVMREMEYKKCYRILGISEDSDQEQIRKAYLLLVKKYHPDNVEGDVTKFQEVDKAFRMLTEKKSRERWGVDENEDVKEQDIKHVAPQHRQYLSYDGYGSGTIFQRQKQYTKFKAAQAAENVLQHRIQKVVAEENALMKKVPLKHKIKTKYGFDRLVEDLIQEAMSKGQFNNLSGCGKPLKGIQNRNPYVDFVTHKINEVLIENGFTPEWITLQKDIRQEIETLRQSLKMEREYFGPNPLSPEEANKWDQIIDKHQKLLDNINKKINKFNLVVPVLTKQMLYVNLEKEANNVLVNGKCNLDGNSNRINSDNNQIPEDTEVGNIFGFLDTIFRKL